MRKVLILDHWYNVSGGASKAALYTELSKCHDLIFVKVDFPTWCRVMGYAKTFHPDICKWKQRKSRFHETLQKRPKTFHLLTRLYSKAVKKIDVSYDIILQIGSLFGPVDNPRGVPYFSYSDSTVRNPDLMWKPWMPSDFDRYRDEWYVLEKSCFQQLTGAMFYSQWAANTLVTEYGIDSAKVHVVGSALKIPDEYTVDWSCREKQVVFVSTAFELKGGYELIDIFTQVVTQVPDAVLKIIGNVPESIQRLNHPWLKLMGALPRPEVVEAYKQASLFVLPTQYDAFPSVILEAANFEVPSVASNICGIPEMIIDGQTGFLAEKGNIAQFAEKIIRVLRDRELNIRMGKAAKQFVWEQFHPKVVARRIKKIIEMDI